MSNLPTAPSALSYSTIPPPAPDRPRTSGWAVTSLVLGLLACVPFVTGLGAVLTGILGIRSTNNPHRTGRGLAVAGLVLGVISIGFWSLGGLALMTAWRATGPAVATGETFFRHLAAGDINSASAMAGTAVSPDALDQISEQIQAGGGLQSISTPSRSFDVSNGMTTATIGGSLEFARESRSFTMTLVKVGDAWQITSVDVQ